jgi:hypothetical protein
MQDPELAATNRARWQKPIVPTTAIDPGGVAQPVVPGAPVLPTARPPVVRAPLPRGGDLYGGYTVAQLTANPALVARLAPHAAQRWAARAPAAVATPAVPTPAAPGTPITEGPPVGTFAPGPVPAAPGPGQGGPPAGWNYGQGGAANEFTDPMQMFMSAIPGMRLNTQKQIADAMATAGGTGNRWGTSAQRTAGQIGAESAMQENAMLQSLLSNYANNQENRALQATGQGTALGALQDQMAQNRIGTEAGLGQYEQNRQDQFANTRFQDWSANRLGWLGPMLQFAGQQGAGSPPSAGQIYTTQTAGEPGGADGLTLLANLFK